LQKRWIKSKDKTRNRIHAAKSLARRSRIKNVYIAPVGRIDSSPGQSYVSGPLQLQAPEHFSLINNPDRCASVLHNLLDPWSNKIFFDMEGVTKLTPDAILLLSASIRNLSGRGIFVQGNYPLDPLANEAIRQSGFDDYFNKHARQQPHSRGQMVCEDRLDVDSKRAEAKLAKKLIDFASDQQGVPPRLQCVYGHLVDCMTNTHEHAAIDPGTERWWASVFVDKDRGCDCFTFLDLGVGIFESI
jgi:hypothetical protein